jgi:protease-4
MAAWLAGHPAKSDGRAIGVVTVAGSITDGKAGPGSAGGERIAKLIDGASSKKLAALVVRVDRPAVRRDGPEAIRAAILRQKARGVPVVISMANVAASGGYWFRPLAPKFFAQPGTITGSIGILP